MEIQIEDLRRLELRPGDKFVLTYPGILSMEMASRIREAWNLFTGDDQEAFPLLLIDTGATISVLAGVAVTA